MEQTEELLSGFAEKYRLKTAFEKDSAGEHIQECPRIIPGRRGASQIFEWDDTQLGVMFMPDPQGLRPPGRTWNSRKAKLIAAGCTILQDCDGEGSALFDPANPKQARAAIQVSGVRPKRNPIPPSPAQLAARSAFAARMTERVMA